MRHVLSPQVAIIHALWELWPDLVRASHVTYTASFSSDGSMAVTDGAETQSFSPEDVAKAIAVSLGLQGSVTMTVHRGPDHMFTVTIQEG